MQNLLGNSPTKLNIERKKWKLCKFGDVAIQQKDTVDRDGTELTYYVKGEHMGSEDMYLREWGELKDEYLGPAFIRKFEKGDILYGSRRTYLRKVVIAPFEGITSNTTFVIKADESVIDKRLLPFLMVSEGFSQHSIRNSKGSVNPYVNWKDLANYEFLLPPKDQQAELAELLWAVDDLIECESGFLHRVDVAKRAYEISAILKYKPGIEDDLPVGYKIYRLKDIADISGGATPLRDNPAFWGGKIPWLTPTDVTKHADIHMSKTKENITEAGLKSISNKLYPPESILYCSRATIGFAIINDVDMATNQGFSNFICNDLIRNHFLFFLLRHITPELIRLAGGSTFLEISKAAMRMFKVVVPDLQSQEKIEKNILCYENTIDSIKARIESSRMLQKSLINQVF